MKTRRAKVVYSYVPQNDDELRLEVDDVIEVLDEIEEGWWKGITTKGITGVFPSNFVAEVTSDSPKNSKKDSSDKSDNESLDGSKSSLQRDDSLEKKPKPITKIGFGDIFAGGKPKLSPIGDSNKNVPKKPPPPTPALEAESAPKLPPKPVREQARVLFGYEAQNEDELTIKEGDIIHIVSKDIEDVGWWKGELNGRIALFPDNFVELIKSSEDNTSMKSLTKKPERPTEKPPPIANQSKALKSESMKSSNKTFEELPKSSVGPNSSSGGSSAPVIPGKPKVSALFQSKPKQEPPQQPTSLPVSSVKPDVVPLENGSKHDKEVEPNGKVSVTSNGSDNNFTSMDSTSKPLTHLTQSRPKGPSSRRPPSTIFLPKDVGIESKENGDVSVVSTKIETNSSHSSTDQKPTPPEKTPPIEKSEKLPPWMRELRKAQEKRKEVPDETPKPSVASPTKTSPNRFSGDFSNKLLQQTSTPEENVFKPVKLTKPNISDKTIVATVDPPVVSTVSNVVTTTANTTSKTNIVISSATTTPSKPTPKVEDSLTITSTDKKNDVSDLEKEIRALKESTVSRKEFDSLVKQVTELKEVVESQKLSYSKIIKDLINDVAEERKKLATLQIEIDRLRKLSTTV